MEKMNPRIRRAEYLEKKWFDSINSSLIREHLKRLKFSCSHMFTSPYSLSSYESIVLMRRCQLDINLAPPQGLMKIKEALNSQIGHYINLK